MKIDCYISQGCGSEEALKQNIARALEVEQIHAEVGIHKTGLVDWLLDHIAKVDRKLVGFLNKT